MAFQGFVFHGFLILGFFVSLYANDLSFAADEPRNISSIRRSNFPSYFKFGAASAAYQYEGAAFEDGKGPSIWDNFSHQYPNKIADHTTGDVADDFYHRYKADIKIIKFLGLETFRFSISWPRVIPTGKLRDGVNPKGIAFYNNLINELLANGITPFVTIFHWDLPQGLEDEYNGFISPRITADFLDFSEVCFKEFGDRVKHWATFNEPWSFAGSGYDTGSTAPGRCSAWRNNDCPAGNSSTEPYLVAHNMLISHGATAKLYREKYKPYQKGEIGIVLNTGYFYQLSNNAADVEAAQRALDFMYGWFIDPLYFGAYPKSMRRLVDKRLPKFTPEDSELVKGSLDFLGINYYTSYYAANTVNHVGPNISYSTDSEVDQTPSKDGKLIGDPEPGVAVFFVVPKGLRDILIYTKKKYNNPIIYITENGYGQGNITSVKQGVADRQRVSFYEGHLAALKEAFDAGVNVRGFFAWSFLDDWEWNGGFTTRFGLVFVDYKNGLKRTPKASALFFKKFMSS